MREHFASAELLLQSLIAIMCGLFMCITGGMDWIAFAKPLTEVNLMLGVAFAFFVALSLFAVFNVITGVFVENANKL